MSNDYFDTDDYTSITLNTRARSAGVNDIVAGVVAGFDKLPSEANVKQGKITYAVDTGAADVYVVTLPHAPSAYGDGLAVDMKVGAGNTNTGACTINVNSLGAVAIKTSGGDDPAAADLPAGAVIPLRHNGTNFRIVGAGPGATTAAAASAAAASASASAASSSASSASSSASAASSSASAASASETAAAASAASVNLPTIAATRYLRGNAGGTAWETRSAAQVLSDIAAQAQGDVLDDMNTLGTCSADSEFLVGTGAGEFAWESGATVRTSLGLGAVALLSSVGLADIAAAAKGYDMALYAGFDITFVKEDIAVQIYAKFTAARDFTYTSEVADIETAPTGQALTVDVLINGTSVYSTVPEFAATATTLTAGVVKSDGTEDVSAGDVITFKVLQVGSSEPGEGMTFSILGVLA